MKIKTFALSALAAAASLALASPVAAMFNEDGAGSVGSNGIQNRAVTQTANTGEAEKLQIQVMDRADSDTSVSAPDEAASAVPIMAITGDASDMDLSDARESANRPKGEPSARALVRRSAVAEAVQAMVRTAERHEEGIGPQVREIAMEQNRVHAEAEERLERALTRSRLTRFLIGPNYAALERAEGLLEQNRERIQDLRLIKAETEEVDVAEDMSAPIAELEAANEELAAAVAESRRGFSLFGWLVRAFR